MHGFLHVRLVFLTTVNDFRELLVSQEWFRITSEAYHCLEGLITIVILTALQTELRSL